MTSYVYEKLGLRLGTDFAMMILGDDNVTAAKQHPCKSDIQQLFKELGFTIKFGVAEHLSELDYCSMWFSPVEPVTIDGEILEVVAAPTMKAAKCVWSVADIPKREDFCRMHARSVALSLQGADQTPVLKQMMTVMKECTDKVLTGKAARAFEAAYHPAHHWAKATLDLRPHASQVQAFSRRYHITEQLTSKMMSLITGAPVFSLLDGPEVREFCQAIIDTELT